MPVGPLATLVIRRAFERGFGAGLAAGTGVALADALYGAIGVAGVNLPIASALASAPARASAGVVLVVLGVLVVRSPPALASSERHATLRTHAAGFVATLSLGLANPGAIAIVAAVFAVAHPARTGPRFVPIAGLALFAGAMLWWSGLVVAIVGTRERLSPRVLRAFNVVTGSLAVLAGAFAVVRAVLGR